LGVWPAAQPVKAVHDVIADGVYRVVGGAAKAAGTLAERTVDVPGGSAPSRTVFGSGFLAVLQALIGDSLEDDRPILAGPMTFRVDGNPVTPEQLGNHVPHPSPRIVVFLHGLVETEHAWRSGGRPSYAERPRAISAVPLCRFGTTVGCTSRRTRGN
jgi:hypothetical protein